MTQEQITLAIMICDLTEAQTTSAEFKAIQAGANPHDIFDANSALYGAWCALRFAEPDVSDEATAHDLNEATEICTRLNYDRVAIKALRDIGG